MTRRAVATAWLLGAVALPLDLSLAPDTSARPLYPSVPLLLGSSSLLLAASALSLRHQGSARARAGMAGRARLEAPE